MIWLTVQPWSDPTPNCKDLDEECEGVVDKAKCWTYQPERGMCPYLRTVTMGPHTVTTSEPP